MQKQSRSSRRLVWRALKWLLPLAVVAVVVFRLKFAPAPVDAWAVETAPIAAEVMGTGTLEARVKTTLSPRIQERLAAVLVDQGDAVKAGQLLAQLDDGELKQEVAVAEAALAAAKAAMDRTRTDEARSAAVLEQARLSHDRALALLATRVAAQADVDKAVELLNVAEADLKRSRATTVEAERQVVTAEQTLKYQRERLSFTLIVSPYDGLVVRRDRDAGGVVVPGSSILQVVSTNEIWVSAWVDETAMAALAPGQPARVVFRSEPDQSYPGTVARLGREADRETREFIVDVRVERLPANWAVGQRAEVYIETARKAAASVIPQRAVNWRDGRPGVFVDIHGHARWRAVKLGLRGREAVEVVEGLQTGERVVAPRGPASGQLREGQSIKVS